jgi:hypothetical protein
LAITPAGFLQVGGIEFRMPKTEVEFIDKISLFILLLGSINPAETKADSST